MIENTNTKQFYPGPILNNTLEITDFLFNDAEQIKIKHSKLNDEGILVDVDLTYPTDYEVTKVLPSDINAAEAALTASTGQIMLKNVDVLAGEKLTVYRVSQIIQDKDYPRTGAFPAATHEGALDYLTMQNQEQKDEIDRALKVPISTQNFEGSLPLPIPSRALKINNDGTGFEMSEFDPDLALVTTEEFKNQAQQAAAEALASQNVVTGQVTIATQQATIATQQANIATEKTAEVVESGITAVQNIDTAFSAANEWYKKLNAIPYIPIGTILPTTGAIDESLGYQRYANGQLIAGVSTVAPDLVRFLEFQETHAPNLLCSETEWQAALTLSTLGQVGKYVWNKEEDSVRIPRIVNIQGMMDMNTVGNMVEAGLPNITGNTNAAVRPLQGTGPSGAFYVTENAVNAGAGTGSNYKGIINNFDASRSNSTYGNSNTVQEESILYPYVLQIATGVQYKTPVINEIELNIPFFIGYSQYFENAPYNLSWAVGGSTLTRAVHPAYYDALLIELNADIEVGTTQNNYTKKGLPVKLATDSDITDYDFVVNPADETFRLPLLNGSEDLPSTKYDNLQLLNSRSYYTAPANGYFFLRKKSSASNQYVYFGIDNPSNNETIMGDSSISTTTGQAINITVYIKKGYKLWMEYDLGGTTEKFRFIYAQGNGSLYFYVGETVQNANIANLGRIEETMATKPMVDGQWVVSNVSLSQATAIGTYTIDLSNYLPNDGYAYEILLTIQGLGTTQAPISFFYSSLASGVSGVFSNGSHYVVNTFVMPVGSDRVLTMTLSQDNFQTHRTNACAYRRLGTNQ